MVTKMKIVGTLFAFSLKFIFNLETQKPELVNFKMAPPRYFENKASYGMSTPTSKLSTDFSGGDIFPFFRDEHSHQ